MVSTVVIYVKFSIQQCLHYLSSMHSLSAAVKGSWLFLNRFLCSSHISIQNHVLYTSRLYSYIDFAVSNPAGRVFVLAYDADLLNHIYVARAILKHMHAWLCCMGSLDHIQFVPWSLFFRE